MGWPGKGGSGPALRAVGITDSTLTKVLHNYNSSGGGIEFVYDPTTNNQDFQPLNDFERKLVQAQDGEIAVTEVQQA